MTAEPILTISGLNVDYGTGTSGVRALRDIDLTLHRGEVLGLAGSPGRASPRWRTPSPGCSPRRG